MKSENLIYKQYTWYTSGVHGQRAFYDPWNDPQTRGLLSWSWGENYKSITQFHEYEPQPVNACMASSFQFVEHGAQFLDWSVSNKTVITFYFRNGLDFQMISGIRKKTQIPIILIDKKTHNYSYFKKYDSLKLTQVKYYVIPQSIRKLSTQLCATWF